MVMGTGPMGHLSSQVVRGNPCLPALTETNEKLPYPDPRISENPDIRKSEKSDIRTPGFPKIQGSGYPDFLISGNPDFQISGYPKIQKPGNAEDPANSAKEKYTMTEEASYKAS